MGTIGEQQCSGQQNSSSSSLPHANCERANALGDIVPPVPEPHAEDGANVVGASEAADASPNERPQLKRLLSEAKRPSSKYQRLALNLLDSNKCRTFINIVIIANSCTVGVDQSLRIAGKSTTFVDSLEHLFIVVYVIELSLQFIGRRKAALHDGWVFFDGLLVFIAVFSSWVLPFMSMFTAIGDVSGLGLALVLRTARLARLARAVRLIRAFRQLWLLVHAFLSSAKTMAYVVMMLGIILYMFSSVAVEVITMRYRDLETPDHIMEMVDNYFPTLPATMLTLVQFVCLDSIGQIYRPIILYDGVLVFYFASVILVVGIVLMNIVTAIIVNSALQQSTEDREVKLMEEEFTKAKLMQSLKDMFERLDADGSGTIDIEELVCVSGEDQLLLSEFSSYADPVDIFKALDIDGGGCLDIDEFCDGLYQVSVSQTPIEIKRVVKQMDRMLKVENILSEISDQLAQLAARGGLVPMSKERLSEALSTPTEGPPRSSEGVLAQGAAAGASMRQAALAPQGQPDTQAPQHTEVATDGTNPSVVTQPPAPSPPDVPTPLPAPRFSTDEEVAKGKGGSSCDLSQIVDASDNVQGRTPQDLKKANETLAEVHLSSALDCGARDTDKGTSPDKLDKMVMPFDMAQSEQRVLHELRMAFMRLERLLLVSCSQAKLEQKSESTHFSQPRVAKRSKGDTQPKLEEASSQVHSLRAASPESTVDVHVPGLEEILPHTTRARSSLAPGRTLRSGFHTASFGLPDGSAWSP